MLTIILSLFSSARRAFQTRAALQAEILALRHQLLVLQRSTPWPSAVLESRGSIPMGMALTIVERLAIGIAHREPATIITWHRKGFRPYWRW